MLRVFREQLFFMNHLRYQRLPRRSSAKADHPRYNFRCGESALRRCGKPDHRNIMSNVILCDVRVNVTTRG